MSEVETPKTLAICILPAAFLTAMCAALGKHPEEGPPGLIESVMAFLEDHPVVEVPDTALIVPLPRAMDVAEYVSKYAPRAKEVAIEPPVDLEADSSEKEEKTSEETH
jgi:hypothetical protein